jgi:hypothetical protein
MLDVSVFGEDYNSVSFSTGGFQRLKTWLKENLAKCPEVPGNVRLAACVANPSKIIGIGLNYEDHAKKAGSCPEGAREDFSESKKVFRHHCSLEKFKLNYFRNCHPKIFSRASLRLRDTVIDVLSLIIR